jgi:3-oxoacyl-[acyl-carrier protein] reductase
MNLGIAGRSAIVTGASRGIGRAIAEELAREGVDVALVARNADSLQAVAQMLEQQHRVRATAFAGDVGGAGLAHLLNGVSARMGPVDIVVNNAGSTASGDLHSDDEAIWRNAIDVKLMGYLRVIRHFSPSMIERRWGRIVNVIGRTGVQPEPKYLAGGAINAALVNLTRALARELGPSQVLVNGINPGPIATTRWQAIVGQRQQLAPGDGDAHAKALAAIPLGRIGNVDDVASLAVLLCSERASFVTGAIVSIDGGMTA